MSLVDVTSATFYYLDEVTPLWNKNIWEYTAKYNAIDYIIHFHIWETSA